MEDGDGKCKAAQSAGTCGPIWVIGWLFTIAFAKLSFWNSVLAIILWPWFLGKSLL